MSLASVPTAYSVMTVLLSAVLFGQTPIDSTGAGSADFPQNRLRLVVDQRKEINVRRSTVYGAPQALDSTKAFYWQAIRQDRTPLSEEAFYRACGDTLLADSVLALVSRQKSQQLLGAALIAGGIYAARRKETEKKSIMTINQTDQTVEYEYYDEVSYPWRMHGVAVGSVGAYLLIKIFNNSGRKIISAAAAQALVDNYNRSLTADRSLQFKTTSNGGSRE
ncbi:MAG: hypothetical protein ABIA75_06900 [Candidatus Neomarinimicrobiota bacterium]